MIVYKELSLIEKALGYPAKTMNRYPFYLKKIRNIFTNYPKSAIIKVQFEFLY